MTDFNVGDKVRYIGVERANTHWLGLEGVVKEVKAYTVTVEITKPPKPNHPVYVPGYEIFPDKTNLELVEEKTLAYKDIQKGDLIRRTFVRWDGSKIVWEGVAHRIACNNSKWMTEGDFVLAHEIDDGPTDVTLELLERPEPPHWAEAKPVGSIFLYNKGVNKAIWKKTSETRWERTFIATNISHVYTINEVKDWVTEEVEWVK
jgi:hypothetical protein